MEHYRRVDRAQVARADGEDPRSQQKPASIPPDVAEYLEGVKGTTGGGCAELSQRRHFAQGQLRVLTRKRLQDAEASLERGHELGRRAALFFRHAKVTGIIDARRQQIGNKVEESPQGDRHFFG